MIGKSLMKKYNPEIYQGGKVSKNYFEGWYFKVVNREENLICAVIPGISFGNKGEGSHGFVQILDGVNCKAFNIKYDIESFSYNENKFEIWIGDNYFSKDRIKLNIKSDELTISGDLSFKKLVPWPSTKFSPNSMGWYAFLPFMECYHGIISLSHEIAGQLSINGENRDFTGGRGYMEKDWGRSFPSSWVWLQSNHFEEEASITCSVAKIPWLGGHFIGFIAGLYVKGTLYQFTTYTGAKLKRLKVDGEEIDICLEDKRYILEVKGRRLGTGELLSPKNGMMKGTVKESLTSGVEVVLYDKNTRSDIFKGNGRNTGIETAGNMEELVVK